MSIIDVSFSFGPMSSLGPRARRLCRIIDVSS